MEIQTQEVKVKLICLHGHNPTGYVFLVQYCPLTIVIDFALRMEFI
jgi:hypothetical protein